MSNLVENAMRAVATNFPSSIITATAQLSAATCTITNASDFRNRVVKLRNVKMATRRDRLRRGWNSVSCQSFSGQSAFELEAGRREFVRFIKPRRIFEF